MIRHVALAVLAVAMISGCKGKQTKTDENVPSSAGTEDVSSTPMSFDPMGSDSGRIEGLTTVNFEYDKSSLTSEGRRRAQGNAEWMKKNPNVNVQIEGHCDARGSIEYNIALGERRANAVKNYMTSLGIPGDRLSVISYGKEKPLNQGDSESAYAANRRANFVPLQ